MKRRTAPRPLGAGLALAMALTLASGAAAAKNDEPREQRRHRSRDILAQIDRPKPQPGWIERHFSIHRKGGLVYTDSVEVRGREFEFNVSGPVQGKITRKAFGLSFEIRF